MAQQINLCTPILLTQKRYFSAHTMAVALCVFMVLGGALCAYWVWNLRTLRAGYQQTLDVQMPELEALRNASTLNSKQPDTQQAAGVQQLRDLQAQLQWRQRLVQELERGQFRPGWGHSDRLRLVAQSIPAQVWVSEVKADASQLEVTGFTLEPDALNTWVAKLAASPLTRGQPLAAISVQQLSPSALANAASANSMSGAAVLPLAERRPTPAQMSVGLMPVWSFHMVNQTRVAPAYTEGAP